MTIDLNPGGESSGGAGIKLRTPPDVFEGANRLAAENARNAGLNAADLAEFDADPSLALILRIGGADTYQSRRTGAWRDITNVVQGPGATDAQVAAQVQSAVTRDFLLRILSLPDVDLNDLLLNAVVTGSGLTTAVTFTQADGSTIRLPLPDNSGGGGSGGSSDGVITGGQFSADGTTLTITRSVGANLVLNVPAALRREGLSQSQVQALIDAAESDDLTTADVAQQISAELASYRQLPTVVSGAINQNIVATGRGDTYRLTGANARTFFLPAASGGSPVPDGWETVIANDSSAVLTITPDGADTIDGNHTLELPAGESVRIQKVAGGAWRIIADTRIGQSTTGEIPDNSIAPTKALAATVEQQKAWRLRLGSARITSGNALPAAAETNIRDVHIFTQDVANGLDWRDIADSETVINAASAGDVGVYFDRLGWVRSGNIITGRGDAVARAAAAAADAKAVANKAVLDRLSVFETYVFSPGGISGMDFPEYIALTLSTKLTDKVISNIRVNLGGQIVADIRRTPNPVSPAIDHAAPFNNAVAELSGGLINIALTTQQRANLKNSVSVANGSPQWIEASVDFTFTDNSTANDRIHFGTNNNAFRAPGVKARFETVVGASPAVLPIGTYEISLMGNYAARVLVKRILLSEIPAVRKQFTVRGGNDNMNVTLGYVVATSTLTYTVGRNSTLTRITAIGDA